MVHKIPAGQFRHSVQSAFFFFYLFVFVSFSIHKWAISLLCFFFSPDMIYLGKDKK